MSGAGFGVLATESVVLKLCADRPAATRVRVDALAMVEAEPGRSGSALAGTIVDTLAVGGRRCEHGRLVRARIGGDVTPTGRAIHAVLPAAAALSARPALGNGAGPTSEPFRTVLTRN